MQKFWRGLFWTALVLVGVGLFARAFIVDVWKVPEDPALAASVAPTLAAGDVVLVTRRGNVGFGDLVRCTDPENPKDWVVGRIAGLPGDHLEIQGERLLVNSRSYHGEEQCTEPRVTIAHPNSGDDVEMVCDMVRMGSAQHMRVFKAGRLFPAPPSIVDVAADKVFLVSDDREYHDDSRDYGMLPRGACKGRILFRLWSKGGWADDKSRLTPIH